ncbi:hypothetical protein CVT25_008884 [Psilocybe cyanescens]|uniref:Uncharacterized protein n=1 Tax=Psilocybe cyanescens TaxID=93625 RepID=A0A409VRL9_PSICY|nr:hypothetical protein CVT25_008884 [Psilocybe cyanescens]
MHLPTLARRDFLAPPSTEVYENSCKNFSWFRWCPIDFALWALIVLVISLVFWKLYTRRRVAAGVSETPLTGQIPTRSRHKGYHRLTLPYPSGTLSSESSPSYNEGYGRESKYERDNSNTLMDPYHVVNNIDNSLISKDAHFDGASVPLPALEQKKSGKLRLGLGINMAERSSPIPEYTQKGAEENQEQLLTPPPPPAYLRNPRWEM